MIWKYVCQRKCFIGDTKQQMCYTNHFVNAWEQQNKEKQALSVQKDSCQQYSALQKWSGFKNVEIYIARFVLARRRVREYSDLT